MPIPNVREGQVVTNPTQEELVLASIKEEEELNKIPKEGEEPEKKEESKEPEKPSSPKQERPVEHIPAWKLKETESKLNSALSELELSKKEREDLKTKIEELSKHPPAAIEDEIREYAESIGAEPKAIQGLVGILQKRFAPPEDYQKIVQEQTKRQEEERILEAAKAEFEEDFTKLTSKYADIGDLKQKLYDLAFSDAYNSYSLEHIYMLEKDNLADPHKKTLESSRGKAEGKTKVKDDELTEKDIDDMTPKEFMEYTERQVRKGTLKRI